MLTPVNHAAPAKNIRIKLNTCWFERLTLHALPQHICFVKRKVGRRIGFYAGRIMKKLLPVTRKMGMVTCLKLEKLEKVKKLEN
ncbi:MAG: hypothetical protein C0613_15265 [Desulfobulbaceae bacterium]|nr:MAG: hypothetical protein C0613_15265 [Desulfobulbaceae bacterium]